jgi:hypothetical protein
MLWIVTGRAAHAAVAGKPFLKEKTLSQLDLYCCLGIVGWKLYFRQNAQPNRKLLH